MAEDTGPASDQGLAYYQRLWGLKHAAPEGVRDRSVTTRTDVAARLLAPGARLLDVGCWGGQGLERMGAAARFGELFGVDLLAASVEEARGRGVRAEVVDLNRQALPFPDGYFDAVTCLAVIAQLHSPEAAVGELARVVRRGGQLVLSVPNVAVLPNRIKLLRGQRPRTSPDPAWDGGQLHYFTRSDTIALLRQSGFAVRGTYAVGRWPAIRSLWPALLSRDLVFDARRD